MAAESDRTDEHCECGMQNNLPNKSSKYPVVFNEKSQKWSTKYFLVIITITIIIIYLFIFFGGELFVKEINVRRFQNRSSARADQIRCRSEGSSEKEN